MREKPARLLAPAICALFLLRGWSVSAPAADPTAAQAGGLSLLVLGSGGPGATGRAGAGYVILLDGRPRILVDAARVSIYFRMFATLPFRTVMAKRK